MAQTTGRGFIVGNRPPTGYHAGMSDATGGFWDGVRGLWTAGCGLLFPPRCVYCDVELPDNTLEGNRSVPLCRPCLAALGPVDWHGCGRCGGELPDSVPAPEGCPRCKNAPLRFDTVIPLGRYHAGLREAVLRMKRPAHDPLSSALGRLLAQRRGGRLAEVRAELIVPVPMFWRRRIGRGKNSPEVLAGCLGRSLRLPVCRRGLVRCRNTLPQAGLAPSRRFENVRGAFRVRQPAAVRKARVLLVNDVLTTGATCSEAARMLKEAGAAMVAVAVVARA